MRARRVKTLTGLGHTLQVGFQLRPVGMSAWPWNKPWHWKVAQFVEDHAPVPQCWSSLVDWALGPDTDGMDLRERVSTLLPWRPLPQGCRDSAVENGSCYCGKVGRADIAALPDGPRSSVIVPDPCARGCTHDHDHDAGGWKPLCSNCPGCWPNKSLVGGPR